MIDLTESLLKAISIVAEKTVEEVSSDTTIKGIVEKIVSTSEGKYFITNSSGGFYAYSQSDSDIYQEGDQVYVLVPEGDLSQKKFIIGKTEEDSSFNKPVSSLLNDYVELGSNIVIEDTYDNLGMEKMQPLALDSQLLYNYYYCYLRNPASVNTSAQFRQDYNNSKHISIDEESFSNSAKQAKALLIRGDFKAAFNSDTIGNYGVIVQIAFEDKTNPQTDDNGNIIYPPKLVAYILDANKMTGNAMKFYDYTSQYMIAPFDGENYLYIDSIIAFSEGFIEENIDIVDGETGETGEEENKQEIIEEEDIDFNIYIDNLEIIALDEISAVSGDYKLRLTTPKGSTIKEGSKNNIAIKATMTCLDQDITKETTFYWGIKDPSITSISKDYYAKIGAGYKFITKESNELELIPSDLTAMENILVCVGVYKSTIILKTYISIYNNNNNLIITIDSDQGTEFQFNEGKPTLTCLINGNTKDYQKNFPDEAFTFVWSKEDPELGSIVLNNTEAKLTAEQETELQECLENENNLSNAGRSTIEVLSYYSTRIAQVQDVSFPSGIRGPQITCSLKNINNYITYSCSVYRGGIYVGYASITLQNSKEVVNNNYHITITNGTQVFQYNEAGISPASERQQEPIQIFDLEAVFHNPQGAVVTPKKVRWVVPQGQTLINIPALGLEKDAETGETYFLGGTYPLSIKDIYDNNCNDNQVIAVVTHADGTEYRQSSNLLFTKIGNIGTNGTDVTVKINELINVPKEECLTAIKSDGDIFYNGGYSKNSTILSADLYNNNTKILGHTTRWGLAGTAETQSRNYKVETSNDSCVINYVTDENKLDNRIVKAQTSFKGKYYYNFYSIPMIEYLSNYSYTDYPIKILRDKTLKTVLYDSSGMNPSYDETQGVNVKLVDWLETGYLKWHVESGLEKNGVYNNPNILLAKAPKSKTGSNQLEIDNTIDEIQSVILECEDTGRICAEQASPQIKKIINDFISDFQQIGADNILSTYKKLEQFSNRLKEFKEQNQTNAQIKAVYEKYHAFYTRMLNEYNVCVNTNKMATALYDKIQNVWRSEWPSTITSNKLCTTINSDIQDIQQLIDLYKKGYDNRSNQDVNAIKIPSRNIFEDTNRVQFLTLLENIDNEYENYLESLGNNVIEVPDELVEYTKILIAYLNIIIDETQEIFDIENENDIYSIVENKYEDIFTSWTNSLGQDIYEIVVSADENIANIYGFIENLYKHYQTRFTGIMKYQVAEESEILNTWKALLNGERFDLLDQIYVIPNETFNGVCMNNNVVGTAFIKDGNDNSIEIAKIYVPIIMTLNTYELAALNGWDGTNIEIGDNYITTPQIGAGIKDETTNTFTGMVMGTINTTNSIEDENIPKSERINKVGLMGYSNGKQSMFIDAETGRAYFGLPEDDQDSLKGANEGRIELIPGGVSKIGNWKIGNRFLYNIINGSYELRQDFDARTGSISDKLMVPHDKHGIILSSDHPYIHVKGEVYEENNIHGINYQDEYNDINPGDSLELRLDPSNKSLFSIIQHTAGLGNEENTELFFGYRASDENSSIVVVKDYVPNQNTGIAIESGDGAEYYVYKLVKNGDNYVPYYEEQNGELTKIFTSWNTASEGFLTPWTSSSINIINSDIIWLKDALSENKFKKIAGEYPVFTLDLDTGIINYNADNLVWNNDIKGLSNKAGWQSAVDNLSIAPNNWAPIQFNYNQDVNNPISKNYKIGKFKNNTNYIIQKITFNYTMNHNFTSMNLDNAKEKYIQFYVTTAEDSTIDSEHTILVSDKIIIDTDILNNNNISVELLSYNNKKLEVNQNTVYYLKMKMYVSNYNVNANCSYTVKSSIDTYKAPPIPSYGILEITNRVSGLVAFETNRGTKQSISGVYEIYTENSQTRIRLKVDNTYDFVIWERDRLLGGGRTVPNPGYAKIFNTTASENTLEYLVITAPTVHNPIYISFYEKEYCTTESQEYTITTNTVGATGSTEENGDYAGVSTDQIVTSVTKYQLDTNRVQLELQDVYSVDWGIEVYNNKKIQWGWTLSNISFKEIVGFIPKDTSYLCITNETSSNQGIPFAKTYWENNIKKIKFYKEYYNWVNQPNVERANQYDFVDIVKEGNIYYKYIKTLMQNEVDSWFTGTLPIGFTGGNLEGNTSVRPWISCLTTSKIFKDSIYWKEFVRVGIDENGRFFTSGIQDKRTYSRTGKIYAFNKVPDLYGQEVRVQNSGNSQMPIIKIFSQVPNINTTYITQNKQDNGNISIRTASNGFVELAASANPDDDNNIIPIPTNSIKVDYNQGIELLSENKTIKLQNYWNNDYKQNNVDKQTYYNSEMEITSRKISSFIESVTTDKSTQDITEQNQTTQEITSNKMLTITPKFTICSYTDVLEPKEDEQGNQYNNYHYKIEGMYTEKNSSVITIQTGKTSVFTIKPTAITLSSAQSKIDMQEGLSGDNAANYFKISRNNGMSLLFKDATQDKEGKDVPGYLELKNKNAYIKMISQKVKNNDKEEEKHSITLYSGKAKITMGDEIVVDGANFFRVNRVSILNAQLRAKYNIYTTRDIHIGYDLADDNTVQKDAKSLYFYRKDANQEFKWVRLCGDYLKKMYDWYNNSRWYMGCSGTTVWFRNIKNNDNPDGAWNSTKKQYEWNDLPRFSSYTET